MSRALILGALAAAACGIVFGPACGGAAKQSAMPRMAGDAEAAPTAGGADDVFLGDPRGEIERLSAEIEALRSEGGMPPEPAPDAVDVAGAEPMATAPAQATSRCEKEPDLQTQECIDVCKLSHSICGNATRICRLAEQLPGDAWAAGKCSSARASCTEATERCCGCEG